MNIELKFKTAIRKFRMLEPGDVVVVGVSGGPDSTALAYLLWRFREEFQIKLYLAHLHHGLRGREADEDVALVEALASQLNLPLTVRRIAVGEMAKTEGLSVEAAGRAARYQFFAEIAQQVGATKIALGHTADDTVETVLMWLIRGAGRKGLAGIPPYREGKIIRPLILAFRKETESYCRENNLPFAIDKTNLNQVYLRNRIRWELLPLLEKRYNPRIRQKILEMAEIFREEEEFLEGLTAEKSRRAILAAEEKTRVIDGVYLTSLHPAMQRRVLRHLIKELGPDPGFNKTEEVRLLVIEKRTGHVVELPGGLQARWRYGRLYLEPEHTLQKLWIQSEEVVLNVPGETVVPRKGWVVEATLVEGEDPFAWTKELNGPWEVLLDWEKIKPPLLIRYRREGDRFIPLGLQSPKKLKDFFIDARIPLEERDQIPLLVDQEKILWVIPLRIDERVRISSGTHKMLRLKVVQSQ